MMWIILVAKSARKKLRKFPNKDRVRIETVLAEMEQNPFDGDIEHLKNIAPAFRRRVGSYRIKFDAFPESETVKVYEQVYEIKRRNENTCKKRL